MDVLSAAVNLVFAPGRGLSQLAPRIGKDISTLSRELNADCAGAKLGLVDAVKLSVLTGDPCIAEAFCAAMDGRFVPNTAPQGAGEMPDALAALGVLGREFGDVMGQAAKALADGRVTRNELAHFERELGQLLRAASTLEVLVRQAHWHGVPGGAPSGEQDAAR